MECTLTDRCAIVTGAARGQGADEARALHAAGAAVLLADVRDDEGAALADELGARARYQHLDVREEADWERAVDVAARAFGPVRVLVNNAGVLSADPLRRTTREAFDGVLAVNATSTFLGMRAVADPMAAAGGGSIVNISSVAGLTGRRHAFAYVASKWAVRGMTKAAALELGRHGIRVNAIFPGAIRTAMLLEDSGGFDEDTFLVRNRERLALGRLGTVEDVASAVVFLCSDASAYITGADLSVDGGWTAI